MRCVTLFRMRSIRCGACVKVAKPCVGALTSRRRNSISRCSMSSRSVARPIISHFRRGTKLCAAIVVAAIMLAGALSWSYAETGPVRFNIVKAGFIVGVGGGSGTLNFQGRNYRLSIGGINVGTIGASAVDLVGTAENLRTAADIVGTYTQGS